MGRNENPGKYTIPFPARFVPLITYARHKLRFAFAFFFFFFFNEAKCFKLKGFSVYGVE